MSLARTVRLVVLALSWESVFARGFFHDGGCIFQGRACKRPLHDETPPRVREFGHGFDGLLRDRDGLRLVGRLFS